MNTRHATTRSQQRGVPALVMQWLTDYGEESHDGQGGVVRYFTTRSVRRMERAFGREPIRRMNEYLRCYIVESAKDGTVITVGKRYQRIRRA